MFNWLKNKIHPLIPADINKGMMSSFFGSVKLGEKLNIPSSCICLISFKDKIYKTLEEGIYILNKDFLIDLYQKQLKGNKQLKKLKLDLFFVNLKEFHYSFDYVDKIPVKNKTSKIIFTIDINLNVNNVKTFSSAVLAEYALVTAANCEKLVLNYVENIIRSYFLKVELDSFSIPANHYEQTKIKLEKHLKKVGLSLNELKISIASPDKTIQQKSFFFENEDSISKNEINTETLEQNTIDQTENLYYNEQSKIEQPTNFSSCPNCNCKIINGSIYCHRCGKSLK